VDLVVRQSGGNLDLVLELYSDAGVLLLTNNPGSQTIALIQTNLPQGRYYLYVRNTGVGDSLVSPPTGYTSYGSVGEYFISGYSRTRPGLFCRRPLCCTVTDLTQSGQATLPLAVTYADDMAIEVGTIDSGDLRVTGRMATISSRSSFR